MFWKKDVVPITFSDKLVKRVAKIPTADLIMWVEQALSETGRTCTSYIKSPNPSDINDMIIGAEAIHYLVTELRRRTVL